MKNKEKRAVPRRRKVDKELDKAYSGLRKTKSIIELIEDMETALEEL